MTKLVNINGTYINPDTVVCVEDVNNDYQGQYIRVTTKAGPEGDENSFEAHNLQFVGVSIEDVVAVIEGKTKAMPTKKKETQELSSKIDSVLEDL